MALTLNINDTRIEPGKIVLGTYGSVGVDRLAFVFSSEWEGLLTKASFYPEYGSPVEVLTGQEVVVPAEMYRNSGTGKLVVSGYNIENNTLVKRKYTLPCELEVPNTIVRKAKNAIPGTESIYEQLRKQMQEDIADALQAAKDSGAFNGSAGSVEVSGTVTLPAGSDATVENKGTSSAAKLVFGIPRGEAGAPGERGASGVYVLSSGETESDIPSDADIALFPTSQSITLLDGKDGTDGTDGRGIVSIVRTTGNGTSGSIDTYTITYTDATTSTFTVQNGKDGSGFTQKGIVASTSALPSNPTAGDAYFVGTAAPYDVYVYDATAGWTNIGAINGIKGDAGRGIRSIALTTDGGKGANSVYTITYTDDSTSTFNVYNGADGTNGTDGAKGDPGKGIVSITRTSGNGAAGTTDTYTITYTDSTTTTFTVYNGADGSGATITVDDELSETSTNPVQNKVVNACILGAIDACMGTVDLKVKRCVSIDSQTLSDTLKAQARTNIGAGTSNFSGNYNDLNGAPTVDSSVTSTGANAVTGKAVYDYVTGVMGDFDTVATQMDTLIGGNET